MTTTSAGGAASGAAGAPPSWHDDALRLGAALDQASAVLVVGRDGEAAAWAALGAARAQAARRRVAVADLVGDAAALADLGEGDEPVGISDSFFYGVTLNKIARPADPEGNLFVLPSGSEPVAVAEVLSSPRWRRLVAGFREAGALLVLAARADAPGVDALADQVDGLVIAGDLGGHLPDAPAPLMVIPAPSPRRARAARAAAADGASADGANLDGASAAAATPNGTPDRAGAAVGAGPTFAAALAQATAGPAAPEPPSRLTPDAPAPVRPTPARATPTAGAAGAPIGAAPTGAAPGRRLALLAAAALVAAAAAGAFVWSRRAPAGEPPAVAPAAGGARRAAPNRDSAGGTAALAAAAPAAANGDAALAVRNPADSGRAAAYALYLAGSSSADGAALPPGVDASLVPAPALTPQLEDGTTWWRLLAGAYPTQAAAEQALARLQRTGVVGAASGAVVRAPYAFLVADGVPAGEAAARVAALAERGVPAYPLPRADGAVALYAGAFERPAQAAHLAGALRAAGVTPALVYRTAAAR